VSSLSIRGIDPELAETLKRKAKGTQKSINQFVLEILRKHVGLEKERRFTQEYDDLDNLFGRWSEKEFDHISRKIGAERKVDEELWK